MEPEHSVTTKVLSNIKNTSTVIILPTMFGMFLAVVITNWGSLMGGDIQSIVDFIIKLAQLLSHVDTSTMVTNIADVFGSDQPSLGFDNASKLDCMRMCMRI